MCILWRNEAENPDTYPDRPQEGGDRGSVYEASTRGQKKTVCETKQFSRS